MVVNQYASTVNVKTCVLTVGVVRFVNTINRKYIVQNVMGVIYGFMRRESRIANYVVVSKFVCITITDDFVKNAKVSLYVHIIRKNIDVLNVKDRQFANITEGEHIVKIVKVQ